MSCSFLSGARSSACSHGAPGGWQRPRTRLGRRCDLARAASYASGVITCSECRAENPEGALYCNACGRPLAAERQASGEERKVVTVVFVDLVGFTAQAERLDPEDVRRLLAPYHERVRAELERFGGTVEKFIGDAVMAAFGAPLAHEDDPERAVRAALAIRDWSAGRGDLQVRIAANTGEALVTTGARVGEGEAMVAGDVVNTAARLQAAAPVDGVLVGETTYRATRDAIEYRERPPVEAKGKAEPVRVWEAVGPLDPGAKAERTPLVGRGRELELLVSLLARVREERSAQLVTLVGVPGIGKSRLVHELAHAASQDESVAWRAGRCLPYGEGVTFWALGEIVKAEAGVGEGDAPEVVARKLGGAVAALVPEEGEARWIERELRVLVGAADGRASDPDAASAAWRRFVDAVGERGPAVLVFEDLHWADDGLLDFLDDLVDWLRGVPVLVVATARPELLERRRDWGGGKANATTISLQPLDEADTARLLGAVLDAPLQLADERSALLERAGGNPLFAEQYARMLAEQGSAVGLPESVQGVIAARLDALPRPEKELLHEAAVHGKVFSAGAVAAAAGVSAGEAERLLRSLERKDFVGRVRTTTAGALEYEFRHVLLRDVAYGQIPRRERAEKHRRAAAWIQELGRPDDHAELLAHHLAEALALTRAVGGEDVELAALARGALRAAGERASSLSAYASAADFFDRALELTASDDPARPRLLLDRVQARVPTAEATPADAAEALEALRAAGDAEGVAQAATLAARIAWTAGDRRSADASMALALAAVADRPASPEKLGAMTAQSSFHMLAGRFEDSIRARDGGAAARRGARPRGTAGAPAHGSRLCALRSRRRRRGRRDRAGDRDRARRRRAGDGRPRLQQPRLGAPVPRPAGGVAGSLGAQPRARGAVRLPPPAPHRPLRGGRLGATPRVAATRRSAYLDELIAELDAGHPSYSDPLALSIRAWIRLERGDAAGADRDSARAAELAAASDAQAQAAAFTVRGVRRAGSRPEGGGGRARDRAGRDSARCCCRRSASRSRTSRRSRGSSAISAVSGTSRRCSTPRRSRARGSTPRARSWRTSSTSRSGSWSESDTPHRSPTPAGARRKTSPGEPEDTGLTHSPETFTVTFP